MWSLVVLLLLVAVVPVAVVQGTGQTRLRATLDAVDPRPVVVVPGAGLRAGGSPSVYLERRLAAARDLYRAGTVQVVLASGDGRSPYHDEPAAMAAWLAAQGVPVDAVLQDPAGLDTHDTCVRAHDVFGVDRAVVVTQDYHVRRALFSCARAGIDVVGVGVSAQSDTRARSFVWHLREMPASWKAFWDGIVSRAPTAG